MLIEHQGKRPSIHESAFVAPSAVVCGDVKIGPHCRVAFGAVLVAQGGSVVIGTQSIIRENAIIRATPQHSVQIGSYVLVGPNAALYGCVVEDEAFLATGVTIFHGARIGKRAEVRINGVVHVHSVLPEKAMVPIGWVAVGDPAKVLPPDEHQRIWAIQEPLNFPLTVYGVERSPDGGVDMKEITRRLAESLAEHRHDRIISAVNHPDRSL
jgi:carbonic anhydrase/acetyltransferase-like protein (isoleucine patch superfamily)